MLKIGYLELNNPLAIASASQEISRELGGSNGSPGLIILGRFDLHQVAPSAVRSRMERIPSRSALGFSTFGGDLDDLAEAAGMAAEEGWLLEVELPRAEGIDEVVGAAKGEGATLSLRLRPNGLDDLSPLAREAREGGPTSSTSTSAASALRRRRSSGRYPTAGLRRSWRWPRSETSKPPRTSSPWGPI